MQPAASAFVLHSRFTFYLFFVDRPLTKRVRYRRGSEGDDGSVDIDGGRLVGRACRLCLCRGDDPNGPSPGTAPNGRGRAGPSGSSGAWPQADADAALAGGSAFAYLASGGAGDRADAARADDARADDRAARRTDIPQRARLGYRLELCTSRVRARSRILHECSDQGDACPRLRSTRQRWERPKPAALPRPARP
jgi:hypothetical protein